MIEATCGACGTVNRFAEADVPVGAKFATCASCKARVALPTSQLPKIASSKTPPPIPVPVPAKREGVIDLADLPAPKRTSALATVESAPKPAPKSALSDVDLPAPKMPPRAPLDL